MHNGAPKYITTIESKIESKLKSVRRTNSEIFEIKQIYFDEVLEVGVFLSFFIFVYFSKIRKVSIILYSQIYEEAFNDLIACTITHSSLLRKIKNAYNNALHIRDERISQFIIKDVSNDK